MKRKTIRVLLVAALIVWLYALAWRYPTVYLIAMGVFAAALFAAVTYCLLRLPREEESPEWTPGEEFQKIWDEIKGKEEQS